MNLEVTVIERLCSAVSKSCYLSAKEILDKIRKDLS